MSDTTIVKWLVGLFNLEMRPIDAARNLLSEHTRSAALASLVKLSGQMPVERKDHPSGITLEDITRELMQPLLRQWLDDNLPDLIERLVQKEIRKMTQNMD